MNLVDENNNPVTIDQVKNELFDISQVTFKEFYGRVSSPTFYCIGGNKTGYVKLMRRDYPDETITLSGQDMDNFLRQFNKYEEDAIAAEFRKVDYQNYKSSK